MLLSTRPCSVADARRGGVRLNRRSTRRCAVASQQAGEIVTVTLPKPLGIVFEELKKGESAGAEVVAARSSTCHVVAARPDLATDQDPFCAGVFVAELVKGGNAEKSGKVKVPQRIFTAPLLSPTAPEESRPTAISANRFRVFPTHPGRSAMFFRGAAPSC